MKKLCPFGLEKRSLGGGKWVVRKEQSFICCNGKGAQLVSVQPKQGKNQQAPTTAGKVEACYSKKEEVRKTLGWAIQESYSSPFI